MTTTYIAILASKGLEHPPTETDIRALGAVWSRGRRVWMAPDETADAIRVLLTGRAACSDCGAPSHGYERCPDCRRGVITGARGR